MFRISPKVRLGAVLAATYIGIATASGAEAAQTVLSYSPWLPPGHAINDAVHPWMERVEEATEGRVRIEMRAAAVGAAREQFDMVRDGLVDVSIVSLGYTPGRFPVLSMGELPFLSSDMRIAAPAFDRLYRETLEEVASPPGVHFLSVYTTLPAHVFTDQRTIESLDDFKGLKLRTANPTGATVLDALGAVPVQKSASEFYELISSGVIDGSLSEPQTVANFNVEKYLNYLTMVPGGLGQSVMAFTVNERKWQEISEEDRAAIMRASGERLALDVAEAFTQANEEAITGLRDAGASIETMSPALTDMVTESIKGVDEDWFAKAMDAGLADPKRVLTEFRAQLKVSEARTK
ncbi:TRAP transporter substrate-binding protein [Vreelandella titanicae]|nr:TRAP transporter substrate-binding protein [Halomonas titanicae]